MGLADIQPIQVTLKDDSKTPMVVSNGGPEIIGGDRDGEDNGDDGYGSTCTL